MRFALHPLDKSLYPFWRFWEPENRNRAFGPGNRQKLFDPPRTLGDNPGSIQ